MSNNKTSRSKEFRDRYLEKPENKRLFNAFVWIGLALMLIGGVIIGVYHHLYKDWGEVETSD